MKKVLITGKNSYIGQSFKSYVEANYPSEIQVDSISVRGDAWREYDFSGYDAVLHVAALVHKNEKNITLEKYLTVNRDLTQAIAQKAKDSKVNQFIFLSTIAVYGIIDNTRITKNSLLKPVTKYGKSKFEAENMLKKLASGNFKIAIVRPPMIYGPDCPGNYNSLRKLARVWSVYPKFTNQRSMIYIDNLSEFLYQVLINRISGIYLPQNNDYVDTSDLIKVIRKNLNKKTIFVPGFTNAIRFMINHSFLFNKVYGSLEIDSALSIYNINYNKVAFIESIKTTEYQ